MRRKGSEDLSLPRSNDTYDNRGNEPKSELLDKEDDCGRTDKDHCPRQRTILVKGPVVVVDAEGNRFPAERETIALCRCGGSMTKPFCDRTHSKAGFRAAKRAVREEEEQGS